MGDQIDPAALGLTRRESHVESSTPKNLTISTTSATSKSSKPTLVAPRVDLEPFYTSLKTSLGADVFTDYKDALASFLLGALSLSELSRRIDDLFDSDLTRIHSHNQLLCGIHINAMRDAPEPPVASWVSANDKPTPVTTKPATGDAAEARLKHEVMHLPPRTRHRLKGITDEPSLRLRDQMVGYRHAKQAPPTSQTQAQAAAIAAAAANNTSSESSASAGAQAGLTKDTDIRRRFNQALLSETRDLAANAGILADRMLPMAYEAGLQGSTAQTVGPLAEYMLMAMDVMIKEELVSVLARTRTDPPLSVPVPGADAGPGIDRGKAPAANATDGIADGLYGLSGQSASGLGILNSGLAGGVLTAKYKKQIIAEDQKVNRGELKRNELGLLPIERQGLSRNAKAGTMGDFRMNWELGDNFSRMMLPWMSERIAMYDARYDGFTGAESSSQVKASTTNGIVKPKRDSHQLLNGIHNSSDAMEGVVMVNGTNGTQISSDAADEDAMQIDEPDWFWEGAHRSDRQSLRGLLDGVLGR